MNNNDVLRQLRYALNFSNAKMLDLMEKAGHPMTESDLLDLLKKEGEAGFSECPNRLLSHWLDALIVEKRGKREESPEKKASLLSPDLLNNNEILRKIRIAFNLKEEDMLAIFQLGHFKMSRSEISALFRSKGHRNYKSAGDQIVRYFLRGLVSNLRN